jgi:hypothetical protein
MPDLYRDYCTDVVSYIKERALKARQERNRAVGESRVFEEGRLLAFNEVVSILLQHAEGLDLPLAELGLDDLEPDRDLI